MMPEVVLHRAYHLPGKKPEESMRPMTLIFYGTDHLQAMELAKLERQNKGAAMLREASIFWGEEEPCEKVWVMPTVREHHLARLRETYGSKIVVLTADDMPEAPEPIAAPPPVPAHSRPSIPRRRPVVPVEELPKVEVDYRALTNKELHSLVESRGLDAKKAKSKEQLIKVLESA